MFEEGYIKYCLCFVSFYAASNIYSSVLRKVETPVITNQDCQVQFSPTNIEITDDLICTSGARGVGGCNVSDYKNGPFIK